MDASNHDMVGVLAREMNTIFSPLIKNVNRTNNDNAQSYQQLSAQMGRIADFLGAPQSFVRRRPNQVIIQEEEPTINQVRPPRQAPDERVMGSRLEQQPVRQEVPEVQPKRVTMVNIDQDVDEVIHRVRQENMMENNLTTMIERIMAHNGLNTGLQRPNYTSPLSEYALQTELPRGCKIPKFTKFSRDTSESTIEHIARYMTEAEDLANSENLRMKYFPSSLMKNAFTWFTTLPPNSIDTWPHLERLFHEKFYMGQTKISLKELASIKRKLTELINDYLNRFRLLKSRCFTVVPEHELVEMAAGGNLVETEKNDRYPKKTYTFDVTKYDEIFDLLVKDGQMIVPPNTKIPPDLIQNAIKDGRLKFADRGRNQMKVDTDPLNIADTNYAEPVEINMIDMVEVEAVKETGTEGYVLVADVEPKTIEGLNGKATEATEGLRKKFKEISIADGANLGVNMVDLNHPPPPPRDGGSVEVSKDRARGNSVWLSQSQ
ncbi:uncharacterized protein LOC127092745 [Lathyrus oleraceus]|uniref:uncharacterized protein LOC127092745 n=1 Tax=Pisum sativum TaxID=3888 RepID=UPI0021D11B41|nr:uncharacterized protein LOC127092745 [Pisum sativum]